MKGELTPKQQRFADEYLVSANGVDAVRKAGYTGSDATLRSIASENLTKPNIISYLSIQFKRIAAKSEKAQINVYEEFCEQLEFAKEMRAAARESLTVDGKINLAPRAHEINVIYFDPKEKTALKWPRQQSATLQDLLDRVEGDIAIPDHTSARTADMRELALKTIDRADLCIDKFAKLGGDYSNPRENPATTEVAKEVVRTLVADGWSEPEARAFISQKYPEVSNANN